MIYYSNRFVARNNACHFFIVFEQCFFSFLNYFRLESNTIVEALYWHSGSSIINNRESVRLIRRLMAFNEAQLGALFFLLFILKDVRRCINGRKK
jgi:hypothetical protein